MSCYLRHLKPVLSELGLEPQNKAERKEIDLAVRALVGKPVEKCPEVWKEVKARLQDPGAKQALIDGIRESVKKS